MLLRPSYIKEPQMGPRPRAAAQSPRQPPHIRPMLIRNRGCIARFRHDHRMHRLLARELATGDRPLGSGRCHLKTQRRAHAHRCTARTRTRRHCWTRVSRCNHVWMGVPKPVLGRSITLRGSGTRGLFPSTRLDNDLLFVVTDATCLSNLTSTNGTRTSRECALLGWFVSRNG